MKDKWIHELKNKMSDHNEAVPEGLWEDIQEEIFNYKKENVIPFIVQKNSNYKKYISIVASIVSIFTATIIPIILNKEIVSNTTNNIISNYDNFKVENNDVSTSKKFNNEITKIKPYKKNKETNFNTTSKNNDNENKVLEFKKIENKNILKPLNINVKNLEVAQNTYKYKKKKQFNVKLNTMQFNGTSNQNFDGFTTISGEPIEDKYNTNSNHFQNIITDVQNKNFENETHIQHRNPINFGLNMDFKLSENLTIGTGLNYTRLNSEIVYGQQLNRLTTIQDIHYLGVPAYVTYKLFKSKNIEGYGIAGTIIDKPIYAKEKTFIINEGKKVMEENLNLNVNKLQITNYAGIGLSHKLNNNLDFYAEPIIRYHINNGQKTETLFQQKPININIKFGLRFKLNK